MKKRIIAVLLVLIVLFSAIPPVQASIELTTSAFICINNVFNECDYKLSNDEFESMHEEVISHTDLKDADRDETNSYRVMNPQREMNKGIACYDCGSNEAVTWLINRNVISRPVSISAKAKMSVDRSRDLTDIGAANKTEFLTALYKAENGVIPSNLIAFKMVAGRGPTNGETDPSLIENGGGGAGADYWDDLVDADCTGDYFVYRSPNVYELYLEQLTAAGIIKKSDVDWESCGENWKPGKDTRVVAAGDEEMPLGKTIIVDRKGIDEGGEPEYFESETLTVREALRFIAAYLRQYENMSNTELAVISYKYGLTNLYRVDASIKDDICLLVAAGIISFDTGTDYVSLSGSVLSKSHMYDLVYRVANKGARYDFKHVQLTDSETELYKLGYSQSNITLHSPTVSPIVRQVDVTPVGSEKVASIKEPSFFASSFFGGLVPYQVYADETQSMWQVTMEFDSVYGESPTGNEYEYKAFNGGETFTIKGDLAEKCKARWPSGEETGTDVNSGTPEVDSVKPAESGTFFEGKEVMVWQVKFNVVAATRSEALKRLKSQIRVKKMSSDFVFEGISRISDENGNQVSTLINKRSLQQLQEITILADKLLMNNVTGTQCLIQTSVNTSGGDDKIVGNASSGYALIGNQIISTSDVLILNKGDEVYYNLEVILALLGKSSLKDLGLKANSIVTDLYPLVGIKEYRAPYVMERTDLQGGKFSYLGFKQNSKGVWKVVESKSAMKFESSNEGDTKPESSVEWLYNTSTLHNALNSLVRTFSVKVGSEYKDFTFIVDYVYYAPTQVDASAVKTVTEYQSLLYERPTDVLGQVWWDRHYEMSNLLANFMYGTTNRVYIRTGYLVPKLTVILPAGMNKKDRVDFLKAEDSNLYAKAFCDFLSEYIRNVSKTCEPGGVNSGKWWLNYYGGKSSTKRGDELNESIEGLFKHCVGEGKVGEYTEQIELFKTYLELIGACKITTLQAYDDNKYGYVCTEVTSSGKSSKRKVPFAYVSKAGCVYRNIEEPKGLIKRAKNVANEYASYVVEQNASYLTPDYKTSPSNTALLAKLTVSNETETNMLRFQYIEAERGVSSELLKVNANTIIQVSRIPQNEDVIQSVSYTDGSYILKNMYVPNEVHTSNFTDDDSPFNRTSGIEDWDDFCDSNGVLTAKFSEDVAEHYGISMDDLQSVVIPVCTNTADGEVWKIGSHTIPEDKVEYYNIGTYLYLENNGGTYLLNNTQPVDGPTKFIFAFALNGDWCLRSINNPEEGDPDYKLIKDLSLDGIVGIRTKEHEKINAQQNVYTVGLNNSVINSVWHNESGIQNVNDLKEGHTLIIGDTKWMKIDKVWVSYPIKMEAVDTSLNNIVNEYEEGGEAYTESCAKAVSSLFNGITITSGDKVFLLSSYLNNDTAEISNFNNLRNLLAARSVENKYTKAATLTSNGQRSLFKYKKEKDRVIQVRTTVGCKYVSLSFNFLQPTDDNPIGVYARPLNTGCTEWELITSGAGILSNYELALFNEKLNYKYDRDVQIDLIASTYEVPEELIGEYSNFKQGFRDNVAKDTYNLIRWVTVLLTVYLFFVIWIAFVVLHMGFGRNILAALSKPSARGRRGFDPVRFLSLGIFSLDSDPTLARTVVVTAILICIDVIVAYIM